MLRTPLADVVLKVLRLGFGGPKAFLARALQPPRPESVDAALRDLVAVGAVAGGAPPEEVREASDDDDDEAPEQDGDLFSLGAGVRGLMMGDSSAQSRSRRRTNVFAAREPSKTDRARSRAP